MKKDIQYTKGSIALDFYFIPISHICIKNKTKYIHLIRNCVKQNL